MEKDKAQALLEPWIGKDALSEDLPVPRLVTVELARGHPPSAAALALALRTAGVDATVDDHHLWIADIERSASVARWTALAVFLLIAAAAGAVIAFATRAGIAAHHDTIEVLHLSGASRAWITNLFQLRFARTAALAGLLGAGAAAIIGAVARLSGGGEGLTPVLPVAWSDLVALAPAPLLAAAVAAIAVRQAAVGLLKEMG
jgi:cell division transport system permease protein